LSGFSPDWLAAREDWDHRARSGEVLTELDRWLTGRRHVDRETRVVDLGCGTGSTWRYLTPRLSTTMRWTLVDGDRRLLDIAGEATGAPTRELDLSTTDIDGLVRGHDLVTASALLDLVSEAWLDRLWHALERHRVGLLAGLTYDGRLAFSPGHPMDAVILDLVNSHQRGNKGFGNALGPTATSELATRALGAGWRIRTRRSDWVLNAERDAPGLTMLIDGWAGAAAEISPGMVVTIRDWRNRRLADRRLSVLVGHRDQLALPPA
jgi:SAM-dependent methyltransferase